jgi:phage terminase large subunit
VVCSSADGQHRNSPEEQAETLAGLHEDFLLIIADEASGIPDPVFRPLESTLTRKCNLCLLLFNPTRAKGFAFETHNRDADNWVQQHWNAEESDNVTKESIERYAKKYGRDSNFFKIRVLGIPPTDSEQTVIPWSWLADAVDREVMINENDKLVMSLDVGAGGDDSALVKRTGPLVSPVEVASFTEAEHLSQWTTRAALASDPKTLFVDSIGVGWGVAGSLREKLKGHDIDVVEVNVATQAFNQNRFFRLRDELWWRLREEFEKGTLSLPDDPLLLGDLNTPRYEEKAGKIKVETKKEIKARGVDSPNRADALMQTEMYETAYLRKLYTPLHKKNQAKRQRSSWKTA